MLQQYLGGFNARLRCSDTMLNLGEPEVEQERERERVCSGPRAPPRAAPSRTLREE